MIPSRLAPVLRADTPSRQLGSLFAAAGHELYLVGGTVRDLMLDLSPSDLDYATDAKPSAIRRLLSDWASDFVDTGEEFGTVGVIKDGELVCHITTFRTEAYEPNSRKPDVQFATDIEQDLARRDFTVNALALRLPEPEMLDPHDGLADLSAGILRTPQAPAASFEDDPLRMLRLYRFVATLGFSPESATEAAVASLAPRLGIVSPERIRDELSLLLGGEYVAPALQGLAASGLAAHVVPEFPALAMEADPGQQHKDVLGHTIAVVAKCPGDDLVVRMAALLHDIGKPATKAFEDGKVSFHHHEVVGSRLAKARLKELRYPKKVVEDVARLVYLHMRPHTYALGWTDKAVRRYVRDAGHLLEQLNLLVRCDITTANEKRARQIVRRIDELEERIDELGQQEELDRLRPPIDGNQVMAHLGLEPGPIIGEAMDMLLEHRIDHGPYNEEEAYRLLDEWAASDS